jgi:hypothetical protein
MEEAIVFTNIWDLIPTTFAQDSANFGVSKDLIFHTTRTFIVLSAARIAAVQARPATI